MTPQDSVVTEAVRMNAGHNVGIVIALDGTRPAGVFCANGTLSGAWLDPASTSAREVTTREIIAADAGLDPRPDSRRHG